MTDKELKKLKRAELLQLLLTQSREIDRLRNELDEANKKLEDRRLGNQKIGSIAEASLAAYNIIEETQKAADLYLENVKMRAEELLSSLTPENAASTIDLMKDMLEEADNKNIPVNRNTSFNKKGVSG